MAKHLSERLFMNIKNKTLLLTNWDPGSQMEYTPNLHQRINLVKLVVQFVMIIRNYRPSPCIPSWVVVTQNGIFWIVSRVFSECQCQAGIKSIPPPSRGLVNKKVTLWWLEPLGQQGDPLPRSDPRTAKIMLGNICGKCRSIFLRVIFGQQIHPAYFPPIFPSVFSAYISHRNFGVTVATFSPILPGIFVSYTSIFQSIFCLYFPV